MRLKGPREVPLKIWLKATGIIMVAPTMMLMIYTLYQKLSLLDALYGGIAIFAISLIFVRPYLANLSALTNYVEELAQDKKAESPDLSFLNNVEELSQAVERLNNSWNQRKTQLEASLEESRILIDSLPDMLVMLDQKGHILRANKTAHQMFGKSWKKQLESVFQQNSVSSRLQQILINQATVQDFEFSLSQPVARDYIVHMERIPDSSISEIEVIVTLHDITEIKRNEQTFADFVANASHEIRTPLTSLMGFIETLQTTAKNDKEARYKFLSIMATQAERMAKLITDLLSLSKIEKSSRQLPTGTVDISKILQQLGKSTKSESQGSSPMLKLAKNLPEITGDAEELKQVFQNLISNAYKYGATGKAPVIRAYTEDQSLFVAVEDQGEGIPQKHIPRLTERFYRVDSARSRKIAGTGLGLAIVKQILERHRGQLHITSTSGKGSIFTVQLPVKN